MTRDAAFRATVGETAVRLAPFAYVRRPRDEACAVLESPVAYYRVLLHDASAAAAVGALASGDARPALECGLVDLLLGAGLAEPEDAAENPTLALWDFHDIVFHSRSRFGRHDHPFGGLYRHRDTHAPLPAVAPRPSGPFVELPRPDWGEVAARDPKLSEVLETRRSIREYDAAPIGLVQLAELLYRAARLRGVRPADADLPYEAVDRPFPTGGGSSELELYLTVACCDGLDAGVYHYDAAAHGLRRLDASDEDRRELLAAAARAAAFRVDPQVLITVTARFGRVSWKYSSIAYALTLKHVGVLYQTLYLVATAMGLAPCALGSGDADVAARAFGLDWAHESSVGEFLLGSRADGEAAAGRFRDVVDRTP
jgi:SagB-type dehydrogenase family enzyme